MYCHKCGAQLVDGATFCQKCGAKVIDSQFPVSELPVNPPNQPVQPAQPQQWVSSGQQVSGNWQPTPNPTPPKKKIPKWPFITGGAVVVVLALILVVIFGEGSKPKYDYEAALRAYTPFANSQSIPYTFGEVMDKYLEGAAWDVDEKEDGQAAVTVSGTLKGFGEKVEFTYTLTPNPEDCGNVKFKNDSVTVNSEKSSWEGANNWFLLALYSAYDDGDEELADLSGLLIALGIHEPKLTETYTDEDMGISFKYPKAWQKPSAEMKEFLSSSEELFGSLVFSLTDEEQYLPQFSSMMGIYQYSDPDIQTAAEQLLGDDDEFLDNRGFDPDTTETSVTEVGGIPARVILMSREDGSNTRIYMYIAGDKVYTIFFMRHGKESEQLERCFNAVMDTCTITVPEPTPTPEPTPSPTPEPTPAPTPAPEPVTIIDEVEATYYMEDDNYCEIHLDPLNYYSFDMKVNLYAGIGTCSGVYTVTNEGYHCQIVGEHFRGFLGQDVYEFDLIKTGGGLQYKGEQMGTLHDGVMFY